MNELQRRIFSQNAAAVPRKPEDRRREPRTQSSRPVYVRSANGSDVRFEEVRTMTDFSRTGIYFVASNMESYRVGMQLFVIPALGCFNFEYMGEVVRIESLPCGDYGIAVQLLQICNPLLNPCTVTKSAFESFALVGQIPSGMPRQESDLCDALPPYSK